MDTEYQKPKEIEERSMQIIESEMTNTRSSARAGGAARDTRHPPILIMKGI